MRFKLNFGTKKFTSTIAGASIFIAVVGFFSKSIGFLREIVFASVFGLSVNYDIYLIGAVLPLTINTIIICLAQNYIIPKYNELGFKDANLATKSIQSLLVVFFVGGTFLSILLYGFSDIIISSYFQLNNFRLQSTAVDIFILFLITIPLTSIISVLIAYQQSIFEFRYFIISNILLNLLILISVVLLSSINVYAIPVGYLIGTILQLVYLMIKSKVIFINFKFFTSYKSLNFRFTYSILIIVLIESIGQLYLISDRYFFNKVSNGGISALNYSQTVFLLPISILTIALSSAIFPKFSELISKKSFTELEKLLNQGLSSTILLFVPVMFLFIQFGEIILKIIFERGKFSGSDTILTSNVLSFYSISLVFYAAYGIFNKLIYSAGLIKKLLFITIIGTLIKIILNFVLVENMQQMGLALSTSISYLFFFTASYFLIVFELKFKNKHIFFKELLFHIINGLFALLIAELLLGTIQNSMGNQIIKMLIFVFIYGTTLVLLKNESINSFFRVFNRALESN